MRLLGGGLTISNDGAAPTVDGGRDNCLLGSQLLGYASSAEAAADTILPVRDFRW